MHNYAILNVLIVVVLVLMFVLVVLAIYTEYKHTEGTERKRTQPITTLITPAILTLSGEPRLRPARIKFIRSAKLGKMYDLHFEKDGKLALEYICVTPYHYNGQTGLCDCWVSHVISHEPFPLMNKE